jgi:hypothetical protein
MQGALDVRFYTPDALFFEKGAQDGQYACLVRPVSVQFLSNFTSRELTSKSCIASMGTQKNLKSIAVR